VISKDEHHLLKHRLISTAYPPEKAESVTAVNIINYASTASLPSMKQFPDIASRAFTTIKKSS
jgi:hypothetical protein